MHAVAYSLDGTMVVSGSEDGTAKVWELMTGECLATLHGHTKGVRAVSFSPDSKQVATGSFDNSARLWSIGSAQCTGTLKVGWVVSLGEGGGDYNGARMSVLAVLSVGGAPKVGGRHWMGRVSGLSRGGQCGCRITVVPLTPPPSRPAASLPTPTMQGHNNWVMGVAYSPGKGELLATCSIDGTVKVWDLLNSTFIATLQVRAESACRLGFCKEWGVNPSITLSCHRPCVLPLLSLCLLLLQPSI